MTRLLCFAVAMALSTAALSTAARAESFSFMVGGHHISINAAHNCYSASCVSVAIPGIVGTHRRHSDDVAAAPAKSGPKAPVATAPAPVAAPAAGPQMAPAAPPAETRATVAPRVSLPPPPPPADPVKTAATEKPAGQGQAQPAMDKPPEQTAEKLPVMPAPAIVLPAPDPAPVLNATKVVDAERDSTPLGDWQTEGKVGAVRIEACGKALCGYLINPSSQTKAETILINMKPKSDSEWGGSIFSRASGNTYNATMTLRGANLLRVEACALGHFFCSGNNWTRIVKDPAAIVTSRDEANEPRS